MDHQDSLAYGVVVKRLEDGDWWHGHIVRGDLEYHSELLGRRTNLLFLMVRFGCGATRKSADFYLTLDAEGVPQELCPIRYNGDWGERRNDSELKMERLHIQESTMPQLFLSEDFQRAIASIVFQQTYRKIGSAMHFSRIGGDL